MGRPLRIALTGGIASGKSAVADLFAGLGVPVIDSDVIAREVVAPGQPALAAIRAAFDPAVVSEDGQLDRAALRDIVFADTAARRRLEELLHPAIRARMDALSEAADGPYQILVIPLLVETGRADDFDRVLVVDSPEDLRLKRLLARDGGSPEQARAIVAAQVSREARLQAADDLIVNDGTLEDLGRRVAELNQQYRKLAVAEG